MKARYFIEFDPKTREVIELVRFVYSGESFIAEEYVKGQWVENPRKLYYYRDPPLYHEEIDEIEALEIIANSCGNL